MKPVRHDILRGVGCSACLPSPVLLLSLLHHLNHILEIQGVKSVIFSRFFLFLLVFFSHLIPNSSNDRFLLFCAVLAHHLVVVVVFVLSSPSFHLRFSSFTSSRPHIFSLSPPSSSSIYMSLRAQYNVSNRVKQQSWKENKKIQNELEKTIYSNTINSVTTRMLFLLVRLIQLLFASSFFSVVAARARAENLSQL